MQRRIKPACRTQEGCCPWEGPKACAALPHPPPARLACLPACLRLQSSQVQLWVVRMHNGALKPFAVRASTVGAPQLPSDKTEQALVV